MGFDQSTADFTFYGRYYILPSPSPFSMFQLYTPSILAICVIWLSACLIPLDPGSGFFFTKHWFHPVCRLCFDYAPVNMLLPMTSLFWTMKKFWHNNALELGYWIHVSVDLEVIHPSLWNHLPPSARASLLSPNLSTSLSLLVEGRYINTWIQYNTIFKVPYNYVCSCVVYINIYIHCVSEKDCAKLFVRTL